MSLSSLQAQDCDSIARSIVEKIKDYSPDELLPYYDKESQKWGLMSKDGKVLTQPITKNIDEIIFGTFYESCFSPMKIVQSAL